MGITAEKFIWGCRKFGAASENLSFDAVATVLSQLQRKIMWKKDEKKVKNVFKVGKPFIVT